MSSAAATRSSRDTKHPGHAAVVKAETSVAKYSQQPYLYDAVGTVQAKQESTLSSKLMATVRSIRVREGDKVKKDSVTAYSI